MASAAKGTNTCYLWRQLLDNPGQAAAAWHMLNGRSQVIKACCSSCALLRMRQQQPPMQERQALPHVGSLVSPCTSWHPRLDGRQCRGHFTACFLCPNGA